MVVLGLVFIPVFAIATIKIMRLAALLFFDGCCVFGGGGEGEGKEMFNF